MKNAERVRLELPILLPNVSDPRDACFSRLLGMLEGRPGIDHVHIKSEEEQAPLLCVHYDPSTIALARVRELVTACGAQLTQQFSHYSGRAGSPLTARGARTLADRLRTVQGVVEADVSSSGAIRVEYERATGRTVKINALLQSVNAPVIAGEADLPHPEYRREHEQRAQTEPALAAMEPASVNHPGANASEAKHAAHDEEADHDHQHGKEGKHAHSDGAGHVDHDHAHGGIFGEHTELIFAALAGVCVLAGCWREATARYHGYH